MTDDAAERTYDGLAKVRLVHRPGGSILLVDQVVVVSDGGPFWLQPQWTNSPLLHFWDGGGLATVAIASIGLRDTAAELQIEIPSGDVVAALPDRSQVYRCTLRGPKGLRQQRAGIVRLRRDGGYDLRLYHHTTEASRMAIQASGEIWGSAWNFQGNKKLANCSYAYFTNLPAIRSEADLRRIAMASDGRMPLRLDQSPDLAPPDVVMDVYRESTRDREHTVWLWVPAEHVASPHVFLHPRIPVQYETATPFIYRVGLRSGGTYRFTGNDVRMDQPDLKAFDYVVLGDCTQLEGLVAPFDEENTGRTFEIQDLGNQAVHEFWRAHANHPLFTGDVERQTFAPGP